MYVHIQLLTLKKYPINLDSAPLSLNLEEKSTQCDQNSNAHLDIYNSTSQLVQQTCPTISLSIRSRFLNFS